ncbi:hypothetical protein [Rhizosaccharibacter radicis]|uniref:Uncharacterized protein n=1 Tax=Rhizosaccharibacter radicis TaxID=2782605 RepID=A0ABT1W0Y1_9PROT|nr:hypothetical protein [Acetobacteraceae bacterium KSS12]
MMRSRRSPAAPMPAASASTAPGCGAPRHQASARADRRPAALRGTALLLGALAIAAAHPAIAAARRADAGTENAGFSSLEVMQATIDPLAAPARPVIVQEAHATTLRPAPLPDQDLDAPGLTSDELASQQEASLSPHVFAPVHQHFSGDGFANGASLDKDRANRSRPGGGMSLSIPVQ